ncbi:MAG TPA: hypothetical protein VFZ44_15715 [Pyrinomonadaceae bacterium]
MRISLSKSAGGRLALTAGSLLALAVVLIFVYRTACGCGDAETRPPRAATDAAGWGLYDPDPAHVWNRLYRSLHSRVARDGREFGRDELDPLLWQSTNHLLGGPSNREATERLGEFLEARAEHLVKDPLRRAVLQRDLWAVFDWTVRRNDNKHPPEVRALQSRLAKVIRRLTLTPAQAGALPDNYAAAVASGKFAADFDPARPDAPFLPPDLLRPDGAWVQLGVAGVEAVAAAPSHVFSADGRSVFRVLISLPRGREATLAYLKSVAEFPRPWVRDRRRGGDPQPNPRLPQFPPGTRLALVRQMLVVDDRGEPTPTAVTESVQIRVHRAIPVEIPEGFNLDRDDARAALSVYEFRLGRERLFAGEAGGLRAVARDEAEFPLFSSHGIDLFESEGGSFGPLERHLRPVLGSCTSCHFRPGIHSMLSRMPDMLQLRVRDVRRDLSPAPDPAREASLTRDWKMRRESWRLLRELWEEKQ